MGQELIHAGNLAPHLTLCLFKPTNSNTIFANFPQRHHSLKSKTRGSAQGLLSSSLPLQGTRHPPICLKFSRGSGSWVGPEFFLVSKTFLGFRLKSIGYKLCSFSRGMSFEAFFMYIQGQVTSA